MCSLRARLSLPDDLDKLQDLAKSVKQLSPAPIRSLNSGAAGPTAGIAAAAASRAGAGHSAGPGAAAGLGAGANVPEEGPQNNANHRRPGSP